MRKTKKLTNAEYPTKYYIRSFADIVKIHVNIEQQDPSLFVTNATMGKVERSQYFKKIGEDYMSAKK